MDIIKYAHFGTDSHARHCEHASASELKQIKLQPNKFHSYLRSIHRWRALPRRSNCGSGHVEEASWQDEHDGTAGCPLA